jgi:hypothetical protein
MISLKTRTPTLDTQKFSSPMEPVGSAESESRPRHGY